MIKIDIPLITLITPEAIGGATFVVFSEDLLRDEVCYFCDGLNRTAEALVNVGVQCNEDETFGLYALTVHCECALENLASIESIELPTV